MIVARGVTKWLTGMYFEAVVEAENSSEAGKALKRILGLAPEAMRSEAHMIEFSAKRVEDNRRSTGEIGIEDLVLAPSVEEDMR